MKSFIVCLFLIIIGVLVFGTTLKGIWGNTRAADLKDNTEYSLRDRGRYLLTQNLAENKSFALTFSQAKLAAPDAGFYKGKWYELYPPGLSVIAVPFYLLGLKFNLSFVATFAMGGIFGIGLMIFIFLIARHILKMPYWTGILASIIFGFASTALGYTTSFFQQHSSGFLIFSAFYAAYQYKIHSRWGFLWGFYVWLAYGVAIFIDYPNAVLMLPVMVYFLVISMGIKKDNEKYKFSFRPAIVITSILFILITGLHLYYNYVNFGSPTKLSGSLVGFREGADKTVARGGDLNKRLKELSSKKNPVSSVNETNSTNGLSELFVSSDRGLFIFTPIFILSIFGVIFMTRELNIEKDILIAIALVSIFFYASWGDPYGGWSYGPRYLIPVMPVFAIFVAYFLTKSSHQILSKLLAFVLITISTAISVLGAVTTNATPPKTEAIWLNSHYKTGAQYGIEYAFDYLKKGKTSDFLYTYYFHDKISLIDYYMIIFGIIMWIFFIVLFIMPVFAKPLHRETGRGDFSDLSK